MNNEQNSQGALLDELTYLRQRVADLEKIEAECDAVKDELRHTEAKNEKLVAEIQDTLLKIEQIKLEWEATADSLPELICLLNHQGEIIRTNRAVESWGLQTVAKVKGLRMPELLHPDDNTGASYLDKFMKDAWQRVKQNEVADLEVEDPFLRRYLAFQVRPVARAAHKNGRMSESFAVVIVRDMTEQRQLEEQFRHSQKMEAIGRLASGVAHDFNNVLTVISSCNEFLMMTHDSPDDPHRVDVEQIKKSYEQAAMLTRRLLAFSHKQPRRIQTLDLNKLIHSLEKMLLRLLGENIEMTLNLSPSIGWIDADANQIEQLLMNLTVNARDAMPHGGKLIIETNEFVPSTKDISALDEGKLYVKLAVVDTGIGMDKETIARIFEPFFTTKAIGQGTGLGLSIVNKTIQEYGGHILVRSAPNRGTTFDIYLPQSTRQPSRTASSVPPRQAVRGSECVLLVEDDSSVRQTIARSLTANGYTVLEANNADEAIQVYEEKTPKPVLLLIDVILPGLNGNELVSLLKQDDTELKHLYMSGYPNDVLENQGFSPTDKNLLQKPFSPEILLQKIREVLSK